jgi:hypothetical protein
MAKMEPGALEAALANFTGTEQWTQHALARNLLMTDGVIFLREKAEAFWLIDAIASHIATNPRLQREHFQCWTFEKYAADLAVPNRPHRLFVTDGKSDKPLVVQELEYTDFPLSEVKFYAVWDGGFNKFVLMLPSEY